MVNVFCTTKQFKTAHKQLKLKTTNNFSPLFHFLTVIWFTEPAPRSRSTDNLQKYSPLIGRRSQGDSPLTASPLARRVAEESPIMSRDNSSNSISTDADYKRGGNANKEKRISSSSAEEDNKPTAPVKLRSTGLADSLRSPTNGFPRSSTTEMPKSPILKSIKDNGSKYYYLFILY